MKDFFKSYLIKISVLSIILAVIIIIFSYTLPSLKVQYHHLFIVIFFYISCLIFHYAILTLSLKKLKAFTTYFLASVTVKLLFYSTIIIVYILNFRSDAKPFVAVFFVCYVAYTIIDVASLQNFVRKVK